MRRWLRLLRVKPRWCETCGKRHRYTLGVPVKEEAR